MKKKNSETLRMCAGCRQMKPKSELVRYHLSAEHEAVVDETGKGGGRGVYVCRSEACLQKALKTNGIARGLRARS